jgi:hypothetical protein
MTPSLVSNWKRKVVPSFTSVAMTVHSLTLARVYADWQPPFSKQTRTVRASRLSGKRPILMSGLRS